MKRIIICFSLLIAMTSILHAQIANPTQWTYTVKKLKGNKAELIFEVNIKDGWHVYGEYFEEGGPNRMVINFTKSDDYKLIGKPKEVTAPHKEMDQLFKIEVQYFTGKAKIVQPIEINSAKPFRVKGSIDYQVCQDERCAMFNPDFEFSVEGVEGAKDQGSTDKDVKKNDSQEIKALASEKETLTNSEKNVGVSNIKTQALKLEQKKEIADKSEKEHGWALFIASFLAGLVALLTPCVFPMIPMTVSFFMKDQSNKAKVRFEALVFGFSIILIYVVIGTIVAITFGPTIGNYLSTHWLPNLLFFAIFLFFAASFFGLFEIVLPSWLVNSADQQAEKGGILGSFFMALTLVVVSFSCTGPIVGSILVESSKGQLIAPIISMFGFALAFALPFSIFAYFPFMLKKLPKSGGWLNSVKVVLGFIEVAFSLKFFSVADQTYHWNILSREIYLSIWIVLAILMGVYLLGKIKFAHDSEVKYVSVPRLFLAICVFSFAAYLSPGLFGAPLKSLSGYLPPVSQDSFLSSNGNQNSTSTSTLCDKPKYSEFLHLPHGLEGYFDYEQALICAKKQNKPIFIDFTGHGCVNCREMEARVWSDPKVLKRLKENFIVTALYVDDKTELPESDWVKSKNDGKMKTSLGKKYADFEIQFGEIAQPYYVLLDTEGKVLIPPMGFNRNIDQFADFLDRAVAEFNKRSKK